MVSEDALRERPADGPLQVTGAGRALRVRPVVDCPLMVDDEEVVEAGELAPTGLHTTELPESIAMFLMS